LSVTLAGDLATDYLRAGALVGGEPAWDPEFGTADFLMLIAVDNVNERYARRFALAPEDTA
jgi:putative hemolysin